MVYIRDSVLLTAPISLSKSHLSAFPGTTSSSLKSTLPEAAGPGSFPQQPGTNPPPACGVSTLVLHFTDPRRTGFNNANRVENTVAAQQLVRQALLASGYPNLIPVMYAEHLTGPRSTAGEGLVGRCMNSGRERS